MTKPLWFPIFFVLSSYLLGSPVLSASSHASASQQQEIKVPLGFAWNDSSQTLEAMACSGGLIIVNREIFPTTSKVVYCVHGVVGNALEQNLFTYRKNSLVEIEYQYGDKNWAAQNYQDFFDAFRRMYDGKYGPGTQLIKTTFKNHNRSGINSSLTGYQWSQASSVLELFYYKAEHEDQIYQLVSLHYKMP
ncbi:MAG TPA: hypothetical protein VJK54_08795 [Chthoniobacterales bacterium]|nr:hypothetical protein [Chthoniobacterales bacterium]